MMLQGDGSMKDLQVLVYIYIGGKDKTKNENEKLVISV